MKTDALQHYLREIDQLRNHSVTELYKGLEVDFIPTVISPSDFSTQLDYTIGSVHFVEALPDGSPWEIDAQHSVFLRGLKEIFHSNVKDAVVRYYELIREMVTMASPTIVGHLDKIKIQNIDSKFFNETDTWYREAVEDTLDLIHESGAIIEVNTRGLYQKKCNTPYPSPWILEKILHRKIPITLNSDAHHADQLTECFEQTAGLLYQTGFRTLSVLLGGEWKSSQFNDHGIIAE